MVAAQQRLRQLAARMHFIQWQMTTFHLPDMLGKETALHINSVTNSSKKSYALNKHLVIDHLKSTGIHFYYTVMSSKAL